MLTSFFRASLLVAACSGCTMLSPTHEYRNSFATANGAHVSAQLVDLADLKVFIDGEQVIDGRLALPNGEGRFSGQFRGQAVSASCSTAPSMSRRGTSCRVDVGRDSGTLRFY